MTSRKLAPASTGVVINSGVPGAWFEYVRCCYGRQRFVALSSVVDLDGLAIAQAHQVSVDGMEGDIAAEEGG